MRQPKLLVSLAGVALLLVTTFPVHAQTQLPADMVEKIDRLSLTRWSVPACRAPRSPW
jgi:hypothetical protein